MAPSMTSQPPLTSKEYLDACELGIQTRSASYIRARLDAMTERQDKGTGKKCGGGYIPGNATCRKGAGGAAMVQQGGTARIQRGQGKVVATSSTSKVRKSKTNLEKAAYTAGGVLALGSYAGTVGHLFKGDLKKAGRYSQLSGAGFALMGLAERSHAKRTGNKRRLVEANRSLTSGVLNTTVGSYVAGDFDKAEAKLRYQVARMGASRKNKKLTRNRAQLERMFKKPPAPRSDSYAEGFSSITY